jgi:hypothetical protein
LAGLSHLLIFKIATCLIFLLIALVWLLVFGLTDGNSGTVFVALGTFAMPPSFFLSEMELFS